MNQKALLAVMLLLLIGAASAALVWRTLDDATPVHATTTTTPRDAVPAVAARGDAAVTDATTVPSTDANQRALVANGTATARRPFRENAEWVVVRVIDDTTEQPIGGATVFWCDDEGREELQRDLQRTSVQRAVESLWVEQLAERFGWSTTTDPAGTAKVTRKGWTTLAATHDGKYGTLNVAEAMLKPAGGFVLRLTADRSLRVRVLDDRGEPAANVPVSIGCFGPDGFPTFVWNWTPCALTAADGTATLHHLQRVEATVTEQMSPWSERPKGEWRVFAMLAGDRRANAAISLEAPPAEPVELRLPPCGSVRARVEIGGVPTRGAAEIALVCHDQDHHFGGTPTAALPDADGWARFPHVPLQNRFTAYTAEAGGMSAEFDGPTQRGQETTAVLIPAAASVMLRGRLLLPANEPLRDHAFTLSVNGTQRQQYFDLRTDVEGRFTVSLGEPTENDRVEHLWFDVKREKAAPLRATVVDRMLRTGIDDLGDLVLKDEPPFLAGRFVCGDQPFTKEVQCWVTRWVQNDSGGGDWQGFPGVLYHREDDGRFTFRGTTPPGRYQFAVDTNAVLPIDPIEFTPGTTDLVVQIDPGNPLAATVLVPEGSPWGVLAARLTPSPGTSIPKQLEERLRAIAWNENNSDARWNLQWAAMPAGSYALDLFVATGTEPILRIADIRVPVPPGGDPRLEDIDLRQALRIVKTRLLDPTGQLLENIDGFVTPANATADRWSTIFYNAEFALLLPRAPTELLFVPGNHRPMRVFCDREQLDVKLESWPTIDVEVADLPKLPADVRVTVSLEPIDPVRTPYRTQWNDAAEFLPFATEWSFGWLEGNRTSMPIGEGKYRVVMRVAGDEFTIPLTGVTPAEILGSTRSVKLTAPADEWTRALREAEAHLKASEQRERAEQPR